MRRPLILIGLVVVLVAASCGGDSTDGTAEEASGRGDVAADPGLQILAVDFALDSVAILNTSNSEISSGGYWLHSEGASTQLDPQPIGGRSSILFQLDDIALDPADGELALYDSDSFGDAGSIRSYVEWGSTGHDDSDLAISAGIWVPGEFVESAADTTLLTNIDPTSFDVVNWEAE